MSAAIFMSDALNYNVVFYLDDGVLRIRAPEIITDDPDVMSLIRTHKAAIQEKLVSGFDCIRDSITVAELKTLTAAAGQGKIVSVVRLST
ncbi:MAG: hypothetical protein R8M45_11870 [Ghiorsea sp.]